VLISGQGFKRGSILGPIEGVDLVPTLLYSLGLPAARDLDGRIVTDAFIPEFLASQPLAFVPSYERIRGRIETSPITSPEG
jgi:hypothetical protein